MSNVYYESGRLVIDLHNYLVDEAYILLDQQLDSLPGNIKEVKIIHGFQHGSAILNMVRRELKHKRIKNKYMGMNNGVTILYLK